MAETTESPDRDDRAEFAFGRELAGALPFREDAALLSTLMSEVPPVLAALRTGYRTGLALAPRDLRTPLSEGFALFHLLCRRAGLLGATPTSSFALGRAAAAALRAEGLALTDALADDLAVIAVEGYSAGRDELRARSLREIAAESQVWFPLAPGCFFVFLAGSVLPEALERLLEDLARQLFRAEARGVLIDVSRLHEASEEQARTLVTFASTLSGLGAQVTLVDESGRFATWFSRFNVAEHGALVMHVMADAIARVVPAAGYELRARGRLGELIDKVRSAAR